MRPKGSLKKAVGHGWKASAQAALQLAHSSAARSRTSTPQRAQMAWPHGSDTGRKSGAPGAGCSVAKPCRHTQQVKSSVSSNPNMLPATSGAALYLSLLEGRTCCRVKFGGTRL